MLPKWHILFGFVISCILVHFFDLSLTAGTIIFLSSFLIDVDHYFYYVFVKKDLYPFRAIKWNYTLLRKMHSLTRQQKNHIKHSINIFHSIIFWTILLTLSFFFQLFLWIFIGIIIHMVLDLIYTRYHHFPIYTKLCPYIVYIKNKKKKSLSEF